MNGYLLDTNVISKFAPDRPKPSAVLAAWMADKGEADELFISVMTIAEIHKGIKRLLRRGSTAKAANLQRWFEGILSLFEDRILVTDIEVALMAGEMEDLAVGAGHDVGLGDIIIAATAKVRNLVIVTENVRHFQPLGVQFQTPVEV